MATVLYALSPVSLTSYYDPYDGSVLQAQLYFYKAGTLDPFTVYTDAQLSIPHAQPVLTGGSGRVPPVYIGETFQYRVRAFDQYNQLLEDLDFLPGAPLPTELPEGDTNDGSLPPPGSPQDLMLMHTGDMWCSFSQGARNIAPRAVRANGLTIGNVLSGATERANLDCYNLFMLLWQQDGVNDATAMLPVLSGGTVGKGASAQGDWDANKQITLPDLRGRVVVGTDPMGAGAASGRMTGATFSKTTGAGSDASVPGANGGGPAALTLAMINIPHHTHAVTDPTHVHAGVTADQNANHQHLVDGYTALDGNHVHQYDRWDAGAGGTAWTYQTAPTSQRNTVEHNTQGTGAHQHRIQIWTGAENAVHKHGFSTDARATGITIVGAGGEEAAGWATKPFSMVPPFMTLTWYIHL